MRARRDFRVFSLAARNRARASRKAAAMTPARSPGIAAGITLVMAVAIAAGAGAPTGLGIASAAPGGGETGSVTTDSIADGQGAISRHAPPGLGSASPEPTETPPDWAASALPSPITDDDFFNRPADIDALAPGSIIRSRTVDLVDLTFPATDATQIMVRSNDSHDRPIAATATLIVPSVHWGGPGTRPVVVSNQAIDSLGAKCTPSYKMLHAPDGLELPPLTALSLWHGYAVLVPDHEGPNMAYGAGVLAAHTILDAVRGMRQVPGAGLAESPVVLTGYSGGAIATGWAAQLAPSYAPDLELAGFAAGGTPADLGALAATMDGTLGSGLYAAAALGLAREYPQLLTAVNEIGRLAVQSELRNLCDTEATAIGAAMLPVAAYTFPGVQDALVVQRVLDATRMGEAKPAAPGLLYHGSSAVALGDEFIPESAAKSLWRDWCELGANIRYEPVAGEHMIASIVAAPMLMVWIAARFAGEPAIGNCSAAGQGD